MRTTIEIRDEYRARLLEIAARRGEKGFSRIVEDALERYLADEAAMEDARRRALETRGILSDDEAEELRAETLRLRSSWR
jgi:predicted transcriptional regulator